MDTTVKIENGQLVTDLYKKPTDRCQYLLPSSCHPSHVSKNIPFSLAYRLVRICSDPNTLEKRLAELKDMLLGREYRPGVVNSAIERAKAIPRTKALEKVPPKITDRVVFALDFNPQLPSVSGIIKSAWRVMSKDPKMKAVFPKPPMVAWRRPKSLKDKLVKTKVPEQQNRPQRKSHGMRKCNKNGCLTCPYVMEIHQVQSKNTGKTVKINSLCYCESKGIVYYIQCKNCLEEYIGQTGRSLAKRFEEHRGYINNKTNDPTGIHFNLPGHQISDMQITVLENVFSQSRAVREERESMHIREFETEYRGMNKKK